MAQSDIIWYSKPNIYGRKFRCSKRTAAHLDRTRYRLQKLAKKKGKKYEFRIIQGSFNSSVPASAGTHDYDACLDVQIVGMDWYQAQKWLRKQGWAAWVRVPPTFSYHIHMISLPPYKLNWVYRVGQYVPGQVEDYYAHKSGLVGSAPDNTWHPKNIRKTIFSYRKWIAIIATRRQIDRLSKKLSEARRKMKRLRS